MTLALPHAPLARHRGHRALVVAALAALACHGLGWGLWRQHAGQGERVRGEAVHLRFRAVSTSKPVQGADKASPSKLAALPQQVMGRTTMPAAPMSPRAASPWASRALGQAASEGPVMVESGMDEALQAVSARERATAATAAAAAGNAQDPLAINPDAYLPADALDHQPQLAGPWQLNEFAVPPRTPGAPTMLTIAMRLWVSADGHIDAVQVLSAEPEVPWLESLLQNITQTPLRPAYEQGRAVASSWLVEWQLDLSGGL